MKKTMLVLVLLYNIFISVNAQSPKWVSEKGFWIVESNIRHKTTCIVYFYNNEKQLVYRETIEGKELKLNKRKVKMKLKKVLEQTVAKYEQLQQVSENEMLLARVL